MSSPLHRLRAAGNAVLIAHVLRAGFAWLIGGELAIELVYALEARATAADALRVAIEALSSRLPELGAALGLHALIAPFCAQLMLAALIEPRPLHALRIPAVARFPRALALALMQLAALAACAVLALSGSAALAAIVPTPLESIARYGTAALAMLGVLWCTTAHDLASARLAMTKEGLLRSLRTAIGATRGRAIVLHLACIAAGTAAFALGDAGARASDSLALALAVQQACALAASFIRAGWLACTLRAYSP